WLIGVVGVDLAQRLTLSLAVLLLFWGLFALIAAFRRTPPWWIAPMLAMLAYGWAFQLGFLNSYLATGIALWCFALLWGAKALGVFLALPLLALIYLASPWPLAWLAGVLLFANLWTRTPERARRLWLPLGVLALIAMRWFLMTRWHGEWARNDWLTILG